jgi:hypothetical protein
MITPRQFARLISDEDVRKRYIRAARHECALGNTMLCCTYGDGINNAFTWSSTKEGRGYWRKIWRQYNDMVLPERYRIVYIVNTCEINNDFRPSVREYRFFTYKSALEHKKSVSELKTVTIKKIISPTGT